MQFLQAHGGNQQSLWAEIVDCYNLTGDGLVFPKGMCYSQKRK